MMNNKKANTKRSTKHSTGGKITDGLKDKLKDELKNKIRAKEQMIAKLERCLALEKIKQRKAETRRKIELGGLVVKAKMDQYSKAVILGALLDAMETLDRESGAKAFYQSKGEAALSNGAYSGVLVGVSCF